MSRVRKDGKFFTVYLERDLFERLKRYAEAKGQTRTTALERILADYLAAAEGYDDFELNKYYVRRHRRTF